MRFLCRLFPALCWLPRYRWKLDLAADLVAALTLSTLIIPQAMAYAMVAGLPPVYGLYTSIVPSMIFALMSSSRHVVFGPIALISLLIHSATIVAFQSTYPAEILEFHQYEPPEQVQLGLTWIMTFLAGGLQFLLAISTLASFISERLLSEPLINGLTTASSFYIATSQLKGFFAMKIPVYSGSSKLLRIWIYFLTHVWTDAGPYALLMGVGTIVFIVGMEWLNKRFLRKPLLPVVLVTIGFATVLVWSLRLDRWLAIIGHVPMGPPPPVIPWNDSYLRIESRDGTTFVPNIARVFLISLPSAASLAVLSYVLTLSITKYFARKEDYEDEIRPNFDLIAQSVASMLGVILGRGFLACASLSKSAVAVQAGQKTMMAPFLAGLIVLLSVSFFTQFLYYVPVPCLSAVIMMAIRGIVMEIKSGIDLIILFNNQRKLEKCFAYRTSHLSPRPSLRVLFWNASIWWVTFLAVLFVDIDWGLLIAILFSQLKKIDEAFIAIVEPVHLLERPTSFGNRTLIFQFTDPKRASTTVPETFLENNQSGLESFFQSEDCSVMDCEAKPEECRFNAHQPKNVHILYFRQPRWLPNFIGMLVLELQLERKFKNNFEHLFNNYCSGCAFCQSLVITTNASEVMPSLPSFILLDISSFLSEAYERNRLAVMMKRMESCLSDANVKPLWVVGGAHSLYSPTVDSPLLTDGIHMRIFCHISDAFTFALNRPL